MDEKIPATEIAKRSWSEGIWMYLFQDSELQQGKKHVLVVLAPDRNEPAFESMAKEFKAVEKELDEVHNIRVFFEDHPGGLLHEKFALAPQAFHWYLIDIHGNDVAESDKVISVSEVIQRLKGDRIHSDRIHSDRTISPRVDVTQGH